MATKTKSTQDKVIAVINGLTLKKDTLYKIENKLDKSAPDGFQKEGTTKIPSIEVANIVSCNYVQLDSNKGVYDTGFYESSPCYKGLDASERRAIVGSLTREIVTKYEKDVIGEGGLLQTNTEFWDNFLIEVYEGRVFNTADISDLLSLYILIRNADITPVGEEGNPKFNGSDYIVKDTIKSQSAKQKRVSLQMKAIKHFGVLEDTNPTNLTFLLKSLDIIRLNVTPKKEDMETAFMIWLEKDVQNAQTFENEYEKVLEEESLEKIKLKVKVKEAIAKGRIKRTPSGEYEYEEVPLGIDVRSIVQNLNENAELSEIKDKIRLFD